MAKETTWANKPLLQYGSTLAATVVASVWRDVMVRNLGDSLPLYITFYPAVVIVSLVFGLRQGLLAILYSVLMVAYWNLPREGAGITRLTDVVGMVLFAAMCVCMAVMAEVYRSTRDRVAAYERQLALQKSSDALRHSEERYRSLVVATAQIVWTRDPNGKVAGDMPMWRAFTGQTVDQIQGSGWNEAVHPDDRKRTAEAWRKAVTTKTPYETEFRLRRHDGQYCYMAVRGVPIVGEDGEVREWGGTCTDITERKQSEKELERYAAELERSNAELQDFASIASHDLQEPLRKVLAFGEHLKEHSGDKLDELGRDYLARMQNAAQRMSVLIEALFQYSRAGARAERVQPVDMLPVVFGVVADLQERIAQSHARIELAPVPKVMADPVQVRQLMQNLVANALKFQHPDSSPEVVIEGRTTDQGLCQISVRDNGIGFEEKYLERIFRPFQRLHGRSEYEGSGMGLAICRKVVARHGGTITAHSRPGEGSTFVVTFPAVKIPDGERRELWETETEPSSSASCSPKTMTTITT
jgi:PAS domain S-box-containing protein